MKTVLFVNFTSEAFEGSWDNVKTNFAPGESRHMEDWRAAHFAKHLANRELIKAGQETHTSPKSPEQDPIFMSFFLKAYIDEGAPQVKESQIAAEVIAANAEEEAPKKTKKGVKSKASDEEFEGLQE